VKIFDPLKILEIQGGSIQTFLKHLIHIAKPSSKKAGLIKIVPAM
jgi:hypothetical protein